MGRYEDELCPLARARKIASLCERDRKLTTVSRALIRLTDRVFAHLPTRLQPQRLHDGPPDVA